MAASATLASARCFPRPRTLILASHRPSCSDSYAAVALSCLVSMSRSSFSPPESIVRHMSRQRGRTVIACLPSTSAPESSSSESSPSAAGPATRLFVSGLSFRTDQESLTNAFQSFGQLKEVHLVMDKVANRSKGFAFLRYATEDEAKKAIEGMHGKMSSSRSRSKARTKFEKLLMSPSKIKKYAEENLVCKKQCCEPTRDEGPNGSHEQAKGVTLPIHHLPLLFEWPKDAIKQETNQLLNEACPVSWDEYDEAMKLAN